MVGLLVWVLCPGGVASGQSADGGRFVPFELEGAPALLLQTLDSPAIGGLSLREALLMIAEEVDLVLSFRADLAGLDDDVPPVLGEVVVGDLLAKLLQRSDLRLLVDSAGRAIVLPRGISDPQLGRVAGRVVEANSGRPVVGADVRVLGTHALATMTRDDGTFGFDDVPPGGVALEASHIGLAAAGPTVTTVVPGNVTTALIEMIVQPAPLAEMVVAPGVFSLLERTPTAAVALSRGEIETAPQLGEDIYRVAESAPGVATSDLSVKLNVRGARDEALMVRLDGVRLYEPYHLGDFDGALSIIDVESVQAMRLHSGGYPAEFGERNGGVLDLSTDGPVSPTGRSALGLTIGGVRGRTARTFAEGRGQWSVSARRAYVDLILSMIGEADQVNPRYSDALAKLSYDFGPKLWVSVQGLFAGDQFFLDDDQDNDVDSDWTSLYGWVRGRSIFGPVRSETVLSIGGLERSRLGAGPPTATGRRDLLVQDARNFDFGGIRQDWSVDLARDLALKAGYEWRDVGARYDYESVVVREATVSGPEGLSVTEVLDSTSLQTQVNGSHKAGYASLRGRLGGLVSDVGVRYDAQTYTGASQLTPRVSTSFALSESTKLRAAWGRYAQAQDVYELEAQDGDDRFYEAEEASVWVFGWEQALGRGVTGRVEGYRRETEQPIPFYFDLDQAGVNPFPETSEHRNLFAADLGRTSGVEAVVRGGDPTRLLWSGSYTWSKAEHRVDGEWLPLPWDQRHALSGSFGLRTDSGWRIGAAFQLHTGLPRAYASVVADTLANGEVLISRLYDRDTWVRLPSYHRLDIRFTRDFDMRRGVLSAYLDVFNAYNRRNPKAFEPDVRTSGLRVDTETRVDAQLPLIPTFGIRWVF